MTVHHLKTIPVFFSKVIKKQKPCEIRKNDRNFRVGDTLSLHEFDPDTVGYTGQKASALVVGIHPLDGCGLAGWVYLDIELLHVLELPDSPYYHRAAS
jgi:hypothetical protein